MLKEVATEMLNNVSRDVPAFRSNSGRSLSHALWMLREIQRGEITGEKGHRWLGYAQCLFIMHNVINLEETKSMVTKCLIQNR